MIPFVKKKLLVYYMCTKKKRLERSIYSMKANVLLSKSITAETGLPHTPTTGAGGDQAHMLFFFYIFWLSLI